MMIVICHLVLLRSWLYRQCVLLRCDLVCFRGATILKNNKLKSLITGGVTGGVKLKNKTPFAMDDYFEWNKQNSYAALINFLPYEYVC